MVGNSVLYTHQYTMLQEKCSIAWNSFIVPFGDRN